MSCIKIPRIATLIKTVSLIITHMRLGSYMVEDYGSSFTYLLYPIYSAKCPNIIVPLFYKLLGVGIIFINP